MCLSRAHHSRRCSPISSRHSFPKPALAIYYSTKSNPPKITNCFPKPCTLSLALSLSLSLSLHKAPPESPARPPALQKILRIHIHGQIFFTNRVNPLPKECSFSGSPGEGRQWILLQRIPHQPRLCGSIIIKALIFAPKKPFHPWIAERCHQRNSTSTLHVGCNLEQPTKAGQEIKKLCNLPTPFRSSQDLPRNCIFWGYKMYLSVTY